MSSLLFKGRCDGPLLYSKIINVDWSRQKQKMWWCGTCFMFVYGYNHVKATETDFRLRRMFGRNESI